MYRNVITRKRTALHQCYASWSAPALTALVMLACYGCGQPHPPASLPPAPQYPPDHRYTLDELVELSVYRNASLDFSRYTAAAATGLVDQVKALWLPSVRYDFVATAYNNDFNYHMKALHLVGINVPLTSSYNLTNTLAFSEIVSTGGKRTSGLKQAKLLAELTRVDVLRQQDAVACQVATLYQLICLTSQIDATLDDSLRRIGVFRQVAHGLNERGSLRASELDYLEADLLVDTLQQLQVATRMARQQTYAALKQAVGLDPDEPLVLKQMALPPVVSMQDRLSVASAIVQGFLGRPETREVDLFARIAAEQVRFAKAQWAPNIAVFGSEINITGNGNPIVNALDGILAGVLIDVPIYDPAARARLRQALNFERAAQALQHEIEQLLTLEMQVVGIGAHTALTNLQLAQKARARARDHYEASKQAYSRELIPASSVIIALSLDTLAQTNELTALFGYHNARTQLKRVTGDRETPYGY